MKVEASIFKFATFYAVYLVFMVLVASLKSRSSGLYSSPFLKNIYASFILLLPSKALAFLYNSFI